MYVCGCVSVCGGNGFMLNFKVSIFKLQIQSYRDAVVFYLQSFLKIDFYIWCMDCKLKMPKSDFKMYYIYKTGTCT